MKKETQVSFKISLELKKAVDLYCLLHQIKRQDYFRNLVESDKKLIRKNEKLRNNNRRNLQNYSNDGIAETGCKDSDL